MYKRASRSHTTHIVKDHGVPRSDQFNGAQSKNNGHFAITNTHFSLGDKKWLSISYLHFFKPA
jgi:hypothetical protein